MFLATKEEVCILSNMFCKIKSIVFKIKVLTCSLLCSQPCKTENCHVLLLFETPFF